MEAVAAEGIMKRAVVNQVVVEGRDGIGKVVVIKKTGKRKGIIFFGRGGGRGMKVDVNLVWVNVEEVEVEVEAEVETGTVQAGMKRGERRKEDIEEDPHPDHAHRNPDLGPGQGQGIEEVGITEGEDIEAVAEALVMTTGKIIIYWVNG